MERSVYIIIGLLSIIIISFISGFLISPPHQAIFSSIPISDIFEPQFITCPSTTGYFEGRRTPAHQGILEDLPCTEGGFYKEGKKLMNKELDVRDFVFYLEGRNLTRGALARGLVVNATTISLCNSTGNATIGYHCGAPVVAQTESWQNYTDCGMSKTNGTIAFLTDGNWTVTATFTSSCASTKTNVTRLELVNSSNDVLASNSFTEVTLQNNDQLTINDTLSVYS